MPWRLAPDAYWRYECDDLIVALPSGVLRLNATAATALNSILTYENHIDIEPLAPELKAVLDTLVAEGVIVPALEPADPFSQFLGHLEA